MEDAGGADLHVDRFLPIGDFPQFLDLDRQVIRSGPVRVPRRRTLVDTLRKRPHGRDARAHLLPEEHAAAAGLGTLADDHFDGIGLAQVVRIEPIARGQALVHEGPGGHPLLPGHAAVAGGRGGAHLGGGTPQRFLHVGRQGAEAHAGNGDRHRQLAYFVQTRGRDALDVVDDVAVDARALLEIEVFGFMGIVIGQCGHGHPSVRAVNEVQYAWLASAFQWYRERAEPMRLNSVEA